MLHFSQKVGLLLAYSGFVSVIVISALLALLPGKKLHFYSSKDCHKRIESVTLHSDKAVTSSLGASAVHAEGSSCETKLNGCIWDNVEQVVCLSVTAVPN